MWGKPKILFVSDSRAKVERFLGQAAEEDYDVVIVSNPLRAFVHLTRDDFDGVYVASNYLKEAFRIGRFLQNEQIGRMP